MDRLDPHVMQEYLHRHIPLSKAMEVCVLQASNESVELSAPLEPNINHRNTVFGGSASTLAILAAWSLLYYRVKTAQLDCRLVIQGNTMEYTKPVTGTFSAKSALMEPDLWPRFVEQFQRRGRSRIGVGAMLIYEGNEAGYFEGNYVALKA